MKKFKYKARLKGKKQKGEIDAETIMLAKQKRADGYREVVLTEIKPKKKPQRRDHMGAVRLHPGKNPDLHKENLDNDAGRPADRQAMVLVSGQTSNANMKRVTGQMIDKLNSGSSSPPPSRNMAGISIPSI